MVQANELRIGNWVKATVIIKVADYNPPEFMQCDITMIRDCQHYKDSWAWEGIPLSPELLVKCGFKKLPKSIAVYRIFINSIEISINIKLCFVYIDTEWGQASIKNAIFKYLHQIQNLIYSLTQQELPITSLK